MRLNKFIALATGMSRRTADHAIQIGRATVNGQPAQTGQQVADGDSVSLDGRALAVHATTTTIMLHKPAGYVVSRDGQGSKTMYDLLPSEYKRLKPIGRLDKNSSGLLLLTDDGQLAQELTHPSHQKVKIYEATLDKPLMPLQQQMITDYGVLLDDGPSKFMLEPLGTGSREAWRITMKEGRNRQIRRTFTALGYTVIALHRTTFGNYILDNSLKAGEYRQV